MRPLALYRQAVGLRPAWAEGWWFLGTLYYDHDKYAEAVQAFKQTAQIQQKVGAPWAMLGLCEFQLARYDDARLHLEQARKLGLGDNTELAPRDALSRRALIDSERGFRKGTGDARLA